MKTSFVWMATTLLASGAVFAQTQASPTPAAKPANPRSVVAKIGDREITLEEFNKRYEQNSQLVPGKAPEKTEVLKNIVYFELATQEARRLRLHQDPSIKEQFDILLYQAIVRRNIQPKIDALEVSEAEVKKYYEDNPLLRTSHIIFLTRPGMNNDELKALRDRANKVLDEVRTAKKSFEELARQHSEGPSARTGGDVDWGARHKLLPEYYEAAQSLKNVGDVSGVVETPYGFHIIKLTGKKPFSEIDSVQPPYRDFIIRTIRENKGQGLFAQYFDDLAKRFKVTTQEKLIQ